MKISSTPLKGAFIIEATPFEDERGYFFRSYCEKAFSQEGIPTHFPQCNFSYNYKKGTLRGLHFQKLPLEEGKLVRVVEGRILDVIVDLRKDSSTYLQHISVELSKENKKSLFIPAGFAHGFQCLEDNCNVFYQMTNFYQADLQGGIRWDDPQLAIKWPIEEKTMSVRDQNFSYL
ncbi:MAG: dTDP-4-dehydrorhamnose 3,5-epimerase [Proteobacteria bacterium]|nr:dTDP-4-dehydrorhamnose 3,5-epimerase [Pseudomonadota bacterium]